MHKTPLLAAAASAAFIALAGCTSEPQVINAYDPQAEALANAAPVVLPPAITHSRTFRCADNSLIYVDFYNNQTALIRTTQDGTPTSLTQAAGAGAYTAEGYSVSANAQTARITAPGKANQSCRSST
jgi:ABC-type uncharacterized transport system auxiliary subunit